METEISIACICTAPGKKISPENAFRIFDDLGKMLPEVSFFQKVFFPHTYDRKNVLGLYLQKGLARI